MLLLHDDDDLRQFLELCSPWILSVVVGARRGTLKVRAPREHRFRSRAAEFLLAADEENTKHQQDPWAERKSAIESLAELLVHGR